MKAIHSALISAYNKTSLPPLLKTLAQYNVHLISSGGTKDFIEKQGYQATAVEEITGYPSILGGRVKTLHPQVFGGILSRRGVDDDTTGQYEIPSIDLVVVDCYPFEEAMHDTADPDSLVEYIDIGGISLIRAAAKNYKDVAVIPSADSLEDLNSILDKQNGCTTLAQRQFWASKAFEFSAHYDTTIQQALKADDTAPVHLGTARALRYGENPHQRSDFHGHLESYFEQLHGKQLSHNNLVDVDAAVRLIEDLPPTSFAIIKHTNPCGVATRQTLKEAWQAAYAGDPVSAFGGILVTNSRLDEATADAIGELFFEVLIAPGYEPSAMRKLQAKKNRIILKQLKALKSSVEVRSVIDGFLKQDRDLKQVSVSDMSAVTEAVPETSNDWEALAFANTVVKHAKSNAIALTYNHQLVGIGVGQTSRVDALRQAIAKARHFELPLEGGSMASDAFFPFSDSVAIAREAGIQQVIQPGGSKRDQESIDYCNENGMAMVTTGIRHFKH